MNKQFGYNDDPDDENVYIYLNAEGVGITLPAVAREDEGKAPVYAQLAVAAVVALSSQEGCLLLMQHFRERTAEMNKDR